MAAEGPVVLAVAAEDRGHFEAVTRLTDRKIAEAVPWTADILEHVRRWLPDGDKPWASITRAKSTAWGQGLRVHGHFGDEAGGPEAKMHRAQLVLWMDLRRRGTQIDAVILVRDVDRRDHRLKEMKRAIDSGNWPFRVVAAWCQPEVESWCVGCFSPIDAADHQRLAKIRARISFCPLKEPERMTSAARDSSRDAKRIADELFAGDDSRKRSWLELPFNTLQSCGQTNGLADFLMQVDAELVPLFRRAAAQPS